MIILALTSEGRLAPRFTRCAGAEACDLICAHPPVGYRRIWRGCVLPHIPEATGASKDDSGIRLPLTSKPSKRQDLVDAMVLANPSAANGDAKLYYR
jgi:hypothetical protein